MSREQGIIFGPGFYKIVEGTAGIEMAEDVEKLAAEYMQAYGVDRMEDLPPAALEQFEQGLEGRSWPGNPQGEANG